MDGQWTVCWGALGTGLVGVSLKGEEDVQKGVLQSEDLLVLFRNAPACSAQQRGKKTLAGYGGGMLDVDEQTLEWSGLALFQAQMRYGQVLSAAIPTTASLSRCPA